MRTWRIVASACALLALLFVTPVAAQGLKMHAEAQPDQLRTPAIEVPADLTWRELSGAMGGTFLPYLAGEGTLLGGEPVTLTMTNVICGQPAILVVGFSAIHQDLYGGILVPFPDLFMLAETPAPAPYRLRDGTLDTVETGTALGGRFAAVDGSPGSVPCYQGSGTKAPRLLRVDAGSLVLEGIFPHRVASGTRLYFQFWVLDPLGPRGWCASNAIMGMTP